MKQLKKITLAAMAVLAITALAGASSASATTLEIGGVAQNKSVAVEMTLASGASFLETDTFGNFLNTCTSSTIKWATGSPFSGTTVGGPVSTLSWTNCAEGNTVVHAAGSLSVERIAATTNGTVRSTGAKITTASVFGTITCTTSNTDIGTLTGLASGHAKLDFNAVVPCTLIGSAKWSGTYTVTSPTGLGVTG
jgi:hypothetical protein